MTSLVTMPLASSVTIDRQLPAVIETSETRALAILAKQKSRLAESAALVVERIFDALEQQPPMSDSGTYSFNISDSSLAGTEGNHSEAARYGVSPYAGNKESLQLLETAVRKELGGAFGTLNLSAYRGTLSITLSVQKTDSSAATGNAREAVSKALALHDASAITDNIGARKKELAERRDFFTTIAAAPAMQGVFALAKSRNGCDCAVNIMNQLYLKPNGRLTKYSGGKVDDDMLMTMDLNLVATSVEAVITGARAATVPAVRRLGLFYPIFG